MSKKMNAIEIIKAHCREIGADGVCCLYDLDDPCGCSLDEFPTCDELYHLDETYPAKLHKYDPDSQECQHCESAECGRDSRSDCYVLFNPTTAPTGEEDAEAIAPGTEVKKSKKRLFLEALLALKNITEIVRDVNDIQYWCEDGYDESYQSEELSQAIEYSDAIMSKFVKEADDA